MACFDRIQPFRRIHERQDGALRLSVRIKDRMCKSQNRFAVGFRARKISDQKRATLNNAPAQIGVGRNEPALPGAGDDLAVGPHHAQIDIGVAGELRQKLFAAGNIAGLYRRGKRCNL